MKENPKDCTLVISTYNSPEALEMVLLSVMSQSVLPKEIIISDDGSTNETKELIDKFRDKFSINIFHLWHEDKGFRKTSILNQAICKSTSEYLIQIDGDIIIHKHFVKNHLHNAEKGFFIEGSRVWLNKDVTRKSQKLKRINFSWYSQGIKNRLNAMYIPFLTPFFQKKSSDLKYAIDTRGCNMSFWKRDIEKVNGYNEDLTGWGREDSELAVRLVNAGVAKKRIKFGAIQFHQYHPINSREQLNENDKILEKVVANKIAYCENGMDKYCGNNEFS